MHQFLKFILFWKNTLHVSGGLSSIIRSLRLYIQHQVYVVQVLWLLAACLNEMELSSISYPLASRQQYLFDIYLVLYVQF